MQHVASHSEYALDWMRHAEGYLALVHAELERNPQDAEMHELLRAMTAAIASRRDAGAAHN